MAGLAIYARVSDEKLKEDGDRRQDVMRQVDKLKRFAQGMGWNDEPDVYIDDGISAYKEDYQSRPQFTQLLREIRGHHYSRVLVEDLSRWSRRLPDGLATLKQATEASCTVTSTLDGEVDVTSANGWFRAAISLMFAEWSSRIQSEKVRSGMNRRMNDDRHKCQSCGFIHIGRHPNACDCLKCRDKRAKKGEGLKPLGKLDASAEATNGLP